MKSSSRGGEEVIIERRRRGTTAMRSSSRGGEEVIIDEVIIERWRGGRFSRLGELRIQESRPRLKKAIFDKDL